MEQKKFNELMEKINSDESLKKEFSKKTNLDDLYKFCTSILGGYTKEEFEKFITEIYDSVNQKIESGEISEEELDKVSGGGIFGKNKSADQPLIVRGNYISETTIHNAGESKHRSVAHIIGSAVGLIGTVGALVPTIYTIVQQRKQAKKEKEQRELMEKLFQQSQNGQNE